MEWPHPLRGRSFRPSGKRDAAKNISVQAICEGRWNGAGEITLATGERILYSGYEQEQQAQEEALTMNYE